jgi:structure-specific recognition protein 1
LRQDYERLSKIFKNWYSATLENKEHSLRGWNWGKAEFGKAEISFNVQNRPAFEIPYSEISNTNLAGRNEIAVEFSVADTGKSNGQNGSTPGKGKKAAAGRDQLTEMRFYIPGTTTRKEAEGSNAGSGVDEEEKSAVALFYDTLIEKAEIGETAGDTIATFLDVLHLTPRSVPPALPPLCFVSNNRPEVGSISTCTMPPSACVAKRTTTRFSTRLSRSLWSFPSPTTPTSCCVSD